MSLRNDTSAARPDADGRLGGVRLSRHPRTSFQLVAQLKWDGTGRTTLPDGKVVEYPRIVSVLGRTECQLFVRDVHEPTTASGGQSAALVELGVGAGLPCTSRPAGRLSYYGACLFRWSADDRRLDLFTLENGPVREPGDRSADQRGKPEQP